VTFACRAETMAGENEQKQSALSIKKMVVILTYANPALSFMGQYQIKAYQREVKAMKRFTIPRTAHCSNGCHT